MHPQKATTRPSNAAATIKHPHILQKMNAIFIVHLLLLTSFSIAAVKVNLGRYCLKVMF
jgi:hypothetical protein